MTCEPGSFRDPNGFIFIRDGIVYRQINPAARAHFELLLSSGLYGALVERGWLIPHREAPLEYAPAPGAWRVIQPDPIPFLSYPYEWCFSQLKAAAQLTLDVQELALEHGLTLADASAYNVQFIGRRPIFIDTLSLVTYHEGEAWAGYRQFAQHFLAPLALMAYRDVRLGQLLRVHLDGISLDLASRLLPWRTRLSPRLATHLHLQALAQARYADREVRRHAVSRHGLLGLLDSLRRTVAALDWEPGPSVWGDYYEQTNYSAAAMAHKRELVADWLGQLPGLRTVWDLGCNRGEFSRIPAERGVMTVAMDGDPGAVELLFRAVQAEPLLPLVIELTNPSPAGGWLGSERRSLRERGPADCALALALIHHLAIGNNLPLPRLIAGLRALATNLILEFVPKTDAQCRRLLRHREDIFPEYSEDGLRRALAPHYELTATARIRDTERVLFLLTGR